MEEQRDFKGVWIPKEVWLDERLTALDKVIFAEIDSLDCEDGCFASNAYLAQFCGCSERKVTEAIANLIKCDYVFVESFDGRTRVLRSRLAKNARQTSKKCEAEWKKMRPNNIEEKNRKEIKESKEKSVPSLEEVTEFARSKNRADLAQPFYEYFTTGNWHDSNGRKVRNWKQKFLTWTKFDKNTSTFSSAREYTKDEMNALFQNIDEIEI